ncbi:hypothetical protein Lal_00047458 [Lupinus albus]|nr:hypothetical protein Lal_00047458 [Lupinus albus]
MSNSSSKSRPPSSQPSETTTSSKRKRGVFQKNLQHMMYGFGDDVNNQISQDTILNRTISRARNFHPGLLLYNIYTTPYEEDYLPIVHEVEELQYCTLMLLETSEELRS